MFKKRYTRVDIDSILTNLSGKYGLSQEVLKLVEMDLCSGMTKEDVLRYCTKPISIGRMKVVSECIRNGCADDVIEKLSAEERSDEVMKVVFSLLDKGVQLATFEDRLESKDRLLDFLNEYIEKMPEPKVEVQEEVTDEKKVSTDAPAIDPAVLKETLKGMLFELKAELMAGISAAIGANTSSEDKIRRECEERITTVMEQLKEKDLLLENQTKTLTAAQHTITELEKVIAGMKKPVVENIPLKEAKTTSNLGVIFDAPKKQTADKPGVAELDGRTLSITDNSGKVIGSVPIEHNVKKSSALGGIAASLGIKKRSRRSLMQLAISGELCKEQLIHIVEAIRLGLSETQLCNLIESKVPAERMPSIIEIAKLENEMGYNA